MNTFKNPVLNSDFVNVYPLELSTSVIEWNELGDGIFVMYIQHLISYAKTHVPAKVYVNGETARVEFLPELGFYDSNNSKARNKHSPDLLEYVAQLDCHEIYYIGTHNDKSYFLTLRYVRT